MNNLFLTLRDEFAMSALNGFLSCQAAHQMVLVSADFVKSLARASYQAADAMMAERELSAEKTGFSKPQVDGQDVTNRYD